MFTTHSKDNFKYGVAVGIEIQSRFGQDQSLSIAL